MSVSEIIPSLLFVRFGPITELMVKFVEYTGSGTANKGGL